jgi:hypothetical protein
MIQSRIIDSVIHTFYTGREKRVAQDCGDTIQITIGAKTYILSKGVFIHLSILERLKASGDDEGLHDTLNKYNLSAEV